MKNGAVVHTAGDYRVVEAINTFLDGSFEIVGYRVFGLGADSSWVYQDLDEAKKKADALAKS